MTDTANGRALSALGERATAALMFIFAFPNVLPTPPGTSTLLGAPLIFLAAQLMQGQTPWLPALAISLMALGLLVHDGVWVVAVLVATVAAMSVVSGVVFAMTRAALFFLTQVW